MIDLTDDESKQGALDALRVLLASKIAPLRVEGEESELKMPKNSQQIEDDVDDEELEDEDENEDETDTQNNASQDDNSDEDKPTADQDSDDEDDDLDDEDGEEGEDGDEPNDPTNPKEPKDPSDDLKQPGQPQEDGEDDEENDEEDKPKSGEDPLDRAKNSKEKETKEEKAARIRDELLNDAEEILADIKKDTETRKLKAAQKAKRDELARLKKAAQEKKDNTILNIADFEKDLVKSIKDQLKMARNAEDTFQKPNATYAGSKYVMPAQKIFERRLKPIINIYFDVSGSISDDALDRAVRALSQLDLLVKKKLVEFRIYYFSDNVTPNREEATGCTEAFPVILEHLKATRANNAIIITDDDFDSQSDWTKCSPVTLKGCIWWMWHGNEIAVEARKYIKGLRGKFQYSF